MYDQIEKQLRQHKFSLEKNFLLKNFTTFRIGGSCPLFIQCDSSQKYSLLVKIFNEAQISFIVMGCGSNVLVADEGIPVPVISFVSDQPKIEQIDNVLNVSACTKLDDLVGFAVDHGLGGLTFLSGIPGTVGGAIVGNAGAFGGQIGDAILHVDIIDDSGNVSSLKQEDLNFSYRSSILKEKNSIIVTNACFKLSLGDRSELTKQRNEILDSRWGKHPDYKTKFCAGSFFKNIVHSDGSREAAGKFLDETGCKELFVGDAVVYDKHANIIMNQGNATAHDVLELALLMNERVKKKFGFSLEPEVRLLGLSFD